ncbi:MAG TPA: hypothetical protein VI756_25815 [Blastocatellia bacterium]
MRSSGDDLERQLAEAQDKAWRSLAGYKFVMAGYWMGVWVHLNRLDGGKRPNPFSPLVKLARSMQHRPE